MQSVSIVKKRLELSSLLLKKSTIKRPTTALLLLSGSVVKSNELVTMENQAVLLGVLENHDLTNVCVVVTRYFGGIKLGAGGLIRAYAGSVALAVKEIGIVEIKEQAGIQIQMSYAQYQEYDNFLKEHHLMELETSFTEQVETMIFVDKEDKENIKAALIEFYNGKVTLIDQGSREVEVPVQIN